MYVYLLIKKTGEEKMWKRKVCTRERKTEREKRVKEIDKLRREGVSKVKKKSGREKKKEFRRSTETQIKRDREKKWERKIIIGSNRKEEED